MNEEKVATFTPGGWFFREALERAKTKKEATEIGRAVILELEMLKEWVREQGAIPPKFTVLRAEALAKGWITPEARTAEIIALNPNP